MRLGNEEIEKMIHNVLSYEFDEMGRLHFHRFSGSQEKIYEAEDKCWLERAKASASVTFDFISDSDYITVELDLSQGSSRTWVDFDLYVDGIFFERRFMDNMKGKIVAFDLPLGEHRITLYFSWTAETVVNSVHLSENAVVKSVKKRARVLAFGDSITQGSITEFTSLTYASRLANDLDLELVNQGIAGYYFNEATIDDSLVSWSPDLLIVAYGTNDYTRNDCPEEFCTHCLNYMEKLTGLFPNTKILAILPLYRNDVNYHARKKYRSYTMDDARRMLIAIYSRYKNVTVLKETAMPRIPEAYFVDHLHPNELGAGFMARGIEKEIQSLLGETWMPVASGSCGEAVNWTFDPYAGCLTVNGTGAMANGYEAYSAPWQNLIDDIRRVVIAEGVTTVGDYAFYGCKNLVDVTLAGTVEQIGVFSFAFCSALTSVTLPEGVRVIAAKAFRCCPSLTAVALPESLTNIDMRAFSEDSAMTDVYYGGCKAQWDQIMISMAVSDNRYLLQANIHCMGPSREVGPAAASVDRYEEIIAVVKKALRQGGDGKLYVVAVNLTTPNIKAKSGDCTLVVFPDGQTMMIDCGFTDCSDHVITLLKDLELRRLNYFVLSHTHIDHAGGMTALAEYIYSFEDGCIENYYRAEYISSQVEPAFLTRLKEQGAHIVTDLKAGSRWQVGDVTIDVLNPLQDQMETFTGAEMEVNNLSVLMKVTYGESSYLTGGDIYRGHELELIDVYGDELKTDVAKAHHHGTHTSSSEEWLSAVSPKILFAPAEDIGGTPLAELAAKMGIAYYSVGVDGIVMIEMGPHRDCRVLSQHDSVLRNLQ